MEEKVHIIGIRGEAKQSLAASILLLFLATFFCALFVILGANLLKEEVAVGVSFIIIGVIFFCVFSFLGIYSLFDVRNNHKAIDLPVLSYDEESDSFTFFNLGKKNEKVVIKNGNIIAISGSAVWTARLLYIRYRNEEGKVVRAKAGFARNIDNGELRSQLNRYHKPRI